MLNVAFAGAFAARLMEPVCSQLTVPCSVFESDEAGIIAKLPNTHILVSMAFTREMADAAPSLRLVQVPGAGIDRIDRSAMRDGVQLANAYGHEDGIAEYVLGSMLLLTRSYSRLDAKLRRGEWESQWAVGVPAPPLWPELGGKCLGILGYGHIGQALARRAHAFGMKVCAVRKRVPAVRPPELDFLGGPDHLDQVLQRSDFIVITVSLSDTTRSLIGERQLRLMKPDSFLINVARAEVVDEHALYQALLKRSIAGAALDVWYRYPSASSPTLPAAEPFHELDNVLMTPHISGWTDGMLRARVKLIATNIDRISRGDPPVNIIGRGA